MNNMARRNALIYFRNDLLARGMHLVEPLNIPKEA